MPAGATSPCRWRASSPLAIWRNAARLAEVIRAERVDIVHARSRAPAWSAWLAARRTGAHFVTTYHAPYGERPRIKRAYNAVMAKGELVIAISRYVAGLVAARHGVDPARIRVIPRGVDPAVFDPAAVAPDRLRAPWRRRGASLDGAAGRDAAGPADALEGPGQC